MVTYYGEIIVNVTGAETKADPLRPDIALAAGEKWEDTTGIPSDQYRIPPESMVVKLYADEAKFIALGADVLWYEVIPEEVI